jgi:hypothetical protein
VKPDGGDSNDGRSEDNAFATIGAALDRAADGAEIRVAAGEYTISEQLNVTNAIRLVGAGRDTTIVKAAATGFRILRVDNVLALVEGFTFRDASMAEAPSGASYSSGGVGVLINVGGTVQDCRITNNRLTENKTCSGVAAFVIYGYLNRCVIDANESLATYRKTVVEADAYRIYSGVLDYEIGLIDNCLVYNNTGSSAVYLNRGSGTGIGGRIRNSTVAMNDATTAAINCGSYGSLVENCILRDRTNGTGQAWANSKTTTNTVWISNASAVPIGTNCVSDADVRFRDAALGNFRLRPDSPCRDKGAGYLAALETAAADLDNNPRIKFDGLDIGCYEIQKNEQGLSILMR